MSLADKKCVACEGGAAPLNRIEAEVLLRKVKDWTLSDDGKTISKRFTFKNFADALAFANRIGAIAESEGHHPDLTVGWGKVEVTLTTHAIRGLSENDFILAAKIDAIS
jgi:4a-hydroxytetrahydrobiopterin dehydratase